MLWLSLDFETCGLNKETDRITEVGLCLWSTTFKRAMETTSFFVECPVSIPKEVSVITGITDPMLKKFGVPEDEAILRIVDLMNQCDAVIGQNVVQFDKHFLDNAGERLKIKIPEKLWIDTRTDLPRVVESKSLNYMAADHGFVNPFLHNAVGDALTVLRIASQYDVEEIVNRAKSPVVVLKAQVSFDTNALAKKRKYGWYAPGKMWYKVVKQMDVDQEISEAPFDVSIIKDISVETLWYS